MSMIILVAVTFLMIGSKKIIVVYFFQEAFSEMVKRFTLFQPYNFYFYLDVLKGKKLPGNQFLRQNKSRFYILPQPFLI